MKPLSPFGISLDEKLPDFRKGAALNERYVRLKAEKNFSHDQDIQLVWDRVAHQVCELVKVPDSVPDPESWWTSLYRLSHPILQKVENFIEIQQHPHLICSYQSQNRVFKSLIPHGGIPDSRMRKILTAFADLLSYCHNEHRMAIGFFNPAGIRLSPDGERVFFHLSCILPADSDDSSQLSAPEFIQNQDPMPQSDLLVFAQLATLLRYGVAAHSPEELHEAEAQHQQSSPSLSDGWLNHLSQCLLAAPLARPASIQSIQQSLLLPHHIISKTSNISPKLEKEWEAKKHDYEDEIAILKSKVKEGKSRNEVTSLEIADEKKKIEKITLELKRLRTDYDHLLNGGDSGQTKVIAELNTRLEEAESQAQSDEIEQRRLKEENTLLQAEADDLRARQFDHEESLNQSLLALKEIAQEKENLATKLTQSEKREKPLNTPILLALVIACVLGSLGGFLFSRKSPPATAQKPSLTEDILKSSSIPKPNRSGQLSKPIKNELLARYLEASGAIADEARPVFLPDAPLENLSAPATPLTYWIAEGLTSWLTLKLLSPEQRQQGYHYRIPTRRELAGRTSSETGLALWTRDLKLDENNSELGRFIISRNGDQSVAKWLPPSMSKSFDNEPMGLIIILDQAKR